MRPKGLTKDSLTKEQLLSEIALLEKKFDIIVNHSESVETWILPDMSVAFVSPGIEELTGYTQIDFLKDEHLFDKMIHPDDLQEYKQLYGKTDETGMPAEIDRRIVCKSGETRWIHTRITRIYDDHQHFAGYRTSSIDITSRKVAQMELQRSYTQLKEL